MLLIIISQPFLRFCWRAILTYICKTAEFEARDTPMLPKLSCKCDEAMLGCQPWQTSWDGWGCSHVRGHWHIQGWRHDPGWSAPGLFMFPQISRTLKGVAPRVKARMCLRYKPSSDTQVVFNSIERKGSKSWWHKKKKCGGCRLGGGNLAVFASVRWCIL